MQERIQKIVILLGGVTFVLLAMTADASKVDLGSQWENYARYLSANEPAYRFPHATCFKASALQYELPETLLLAVARGESDFEPTARSRANAHGVMQILWPGTARHLGIHRLSALYDPCTNIDAGARYLRELLQRYDGNLHLSLAAYNYGPGRIQRAATLPDGARAYARKVSNHQARIKRDSFATAEALNDNSGVLFESSTRAERFARSLNSRIDGARFTTVREANGGHRVLMQVTQAGLSTTDIATLETLGWSNLGE